MTAFTKKITAMIVSAMTIGFSAASVFADDNENFTREEIIDELYEQYWSDTAIGTENPEGSFEYHILTDWLDENYGKPESESGVWRWYKMYDIQHAWREYYEEYTENWHYNDDEETREFTIEDLDTDETLYRFELIDGMWNMIDMDGNTVDVFEPHGGDGSWEAILNGDGDEERMEELFKRMGGNAESADDDPQSEEGSDKKTSGIPNTQQAAGETDNDDPQSEEGSGEKTNGIPDTQQAAGETDNDDPQSEEGSDKKTNGKPNTQQEAERISNEPTAEAASEKASLAVPIAAVSGAAIAAVGIAVFNKKKSGK